MNVIKPILNVFEICIHKTGVMIGSVELISFLSSMNYKKSLVWGKFDHKTLRMRI